MLGALGDDDAGKYLRRVADDAGVDMSAVATLAGQPTGRAVITVGDDTGENTIVVVPGANSAVHVDVVPNGRVVLAQLEVPLRRGRHRVRRCQATGSDHDPQPRSGHRTSDRAAGGDRRGRAERTRDRTDRRGRGVARPRRIDGDRHPRRLGRRGVHRRPPLPHGVRRARRRHRSTPPARAMRSAAPWRPGSRRAPASTMRSAGRSWPADWPPPSTGRSRRSPTPPPSRRGCPIDRPRSGAPGERFALPLEHHGARHDTQATRCQAKDPEFG